MKRINRGGSFLVAAAIVAVLFSAVPLMAADGRHRLVVLADMGNEPDEEQQMTHLLVCANEVELEGLVAVTGKYLRNKPRPDLFRKLVDGYAQVEENLRLHAEGWPTAAYLRGIIAAGQAGYGIDATGAGKASPGSRLILRALRRDDPRPLNVVVNAGSNTLAQALRDARAALPAAAVTALAAKLRVFENGAQDNAGAWICHEFPAVHWIRSNRQTYAYGGPDFDARGTRELGPHTWKPHPYSPDGQHGWAKEHVQTGHGALGALYPDRRFRRRGLAYLEGGGTTPWMGLVNRGLYDIDHPGWGGWSGRFTAKKQKNVWSRHRDVKADEGRCTDFFCYTEVADRWTDPASGKTCENIYVPVWRWRQAMFNDFRARMDWCVRPRGEANRHPVAGFRGDAADTIVRLDARPNETVALDAAGSRDPDGDELHYRWRVYPEAGTYPGAIAIADPRAKAAALPVPADAAGTEIHVILEVRDRNDIVELYDYRRVVVAVSP